MAVVAITTSKLPMLNQRMEFNYFDRILKEEKFRAQFTTPRPQDFECGKFIWAGFDEGGTVLVQRIILGLESWIPASVMIELSCTGKATMEVVKTLEEPFKLATKSHERKGAEVYYNLAPSLIDPKYALKRAYPNLWKLIEDFYRLVRNKIFHGGYIKGVSLEILDEIFDVFRQVYDWCDSWCNVTTRVNEIGAGKHGHPKGITVQKMPQDCFSKNKIVR